MWWPPYFAASSTSSVVSVGTLSPVCSDVVVPAKFGYVAYRYSRKFHLVEPAAENRVVLLRLVQLAALYPPRRRAPGFKHFGPRVNIYRKKFPVYFFGQFFKRLDRRHMIRIDEDVGEYIADGSVL